MDQIYSGHVLRFLARWLDGSDITLGPKFIKSLKDFGHGNGD